MERSDSVMIGDVFAWGSGEMGQLGFAPSEMSALPRDAQDFPYQPLPAAIKSLKSYKLAQVAGGDGHSVAVTTTGKVFVWGASACGQLGLRDGKDMPVDAEGYPYQPEPRLVEDLFEFRIVLVACGDAHTAALTSEGQIYSWGGGGCGQLGHPDTSQMPKDEDGCPYQPRPRLIEALTHGVIAVSCGKAHTVAVTSEGQLFSWGAGACGQLGHPDTTNFPYDEDGYPFHPTPRIVASLRGCKIVGAACGDVHTLALAEDGGVHCFGGGSFGQLGLGSIKNLPVDVDECPFMPTPKLIESLRPVKVVKVACGDSHSMAITDSGDLYGWGAAACGQLGIKDLDHLPQDAEASPYEPDPQLVSTLRGKFIVSVACGEAHTLVLTDKGVLYSFGASSFGQLGTQSEEGPDSPRRRAVHSSAEKSTDSYQATPRLVASLLPRKVVSIACGGVHNLALMDSQMLTVASDLFKLFQEQVLCDVTFVLGSCGREERVACHQIVLLARSSSFKDAINKEAVVTLQVSKSVFQKFLEYLYLDDLEKLTWELENEDLQNVAEMMKIAQIYSLKAVVSVCNSIIGKQLRPHAQALINPAFPKQLTGLVFLPDGRVALLDSVQYQHFLSSAILLDLSASVTNPIPESPDQSSPSLSRSLLAQLDREEFSDVTLRVEGRTIHCHKAVLAARSLFFFALYNHGFKEAKEKVVEIGDVSYDLMMLLLRHMYCDLVTIESGQVPDLLTLCDRFSVSSVKYRCEQVLIGTLTVSNAAGLFKLSKEFQCPKLKEASFVFIDEHFTDVIQTQAFEELEKEAILEIMRYKKLYK